MSEADDDCGVCEALSEEAEARRGFLRRLFLPVAVIGMLVASPTPAPAQSLLNAIINGIRFPTYRGRVRYGGRGRRHYAHASRRRHVVSRSRSNSTTSSRAEPKSLD